MHFFFLLSKFDFSNTIVAKYAGEPLKPVNYNYFLFFFLIFFLYSLELAQNQLPYMWYHMEIVIVIIHQSPHQPVAMLTITNYKMQRSILLLSECLSVREMYSSRANAFQQFEYPTPWCLCRVDIFLIFQGCIYI